MSRSFHHIFPQETLAYTGFALIAFDFLFYMDDDIRNPTLMTHRHPNSR